MEVDELDQLFKKIIDDSGLREKIAQIKKERESENNPQVYFAE